MEKTIEGGEMTETQDFVRIMILFSKFLTHTHTLTEGDISKSGKDLGMQINIISIQPMKVLKYCAISCKYIQLMLIKGNNF